MNKTILSLILLLNCTITFACIIDPLSRTAQDPKRSFENTDLVFLGKIIAFDDFTNIKQVVTFSIDKTFKGPELSSVTIDNMMGNSCSRAFIEKGTSYYVFAVLNKGTGNYTIEKLASFVPIKLAEEHGMSLNKLITRRSSGTNNP